MDIRAEHGTTVGGEFLDFSGERYYVIRHADRMAPFFVSVVSSADHWLFASSTGGLTAGRVSPETALFPYVTVDKIHESAPHTGSRTILRVHTGEGPRNWEPFNREHDGLYAVTRNLYKNVLGNKLCFEEINHDLELAFRYTWATSQEFGFARRCELENLGATEREIELVDGLQNILPAGTPSFTQASASNLVDAYKWTELYPESGLAVYTLYSGISDRAEPCESLRANVAFSLGLPDRTVMISTSQLDSFRRGRPVMQETHKRGLRGAYLVHSRATVPAGEKKRWAIVADIERTQADVVSLANRLEDPEGTRDALERSIDAGSDELARIVGSADGFQAAAEEEVAAHHYANVLFNLLRGGVFGDQYRIPPDDLRQTILNFNSRVHERNLGHLGSLPEDLDLRALRAFAREQEDPQLERLCYEYLPITFGRRHGDPSRPWNKFTIRLRDESGRRLLFYEGNWRDIFQNWEALAMSFPEFIENFIAKFVNASTMDGYNPYRITKDGIDWEVEEPDNPWSHIGYWGDHQIIYLLKLLEMSRRFHPERLGGLMHRPIFSYANVPYRIRPFQALLEDPKHTVDYDHELDALVADRVATLGADGRLVLDADGEVYQVNLLEKLLVPLLAKLGNLIVDAGIWLNTQRPEWNDANNALVGHGLSMVTMCYMRRYVSFLQELVAEESGPVELTDAVNRWLVETTTALENLRPHLGAAPVTGQQRFETLRELGLAASRHRDAAYHDPSFTSKSKHPLERISAMLDAALAAIDHSICMNRREDGLYHAYNLAHMRDAAVEVDTLYLMLEGQVAALSSGAIPPDQAASVLEALFESAIYRADQQSFLLYPDRRLPGFLDKGRIPDERVEAIPLLSKLLDSGDQSLVSRDTGGGCRFNPDLRNVRDLDARLEALGASFGQEVAAARQPIRDLYEEVFNHRAFTGRSGTMFGFEGLGCIYWHMVSKLLLATQENFFSALDSGSKETSRRLGRLYYRIRNGLCFNKTPESYGAFPMDPYSHTPGHSGAQQPGMTGQVKEEVLTRFGELGVRVSGGAVRIDPRLLRRREFGSEATRFRFLDVDDEWQSLAVPENALAFTWCQVPVIYRLGQEASPGLEVTFRDGSTRAAPDLVLPKEVGQAVLRRTGEIRLITVDLPSNLLLQD